MLYKGKTYHTNQVTLYRIPIQNFYLPPMNFVVYRSSAGSGKTYTLVKEYLRLALGSDKPHYYRHILAITFTNKAAAEMKSRVLQKLQELAQGDRENHLAIDLIKELNIDPFALQERAQKVLDSILHHYTDFSISTIDRFIHQILRTFAYDLHIPMNFDVEMDSDVLLEQAIDVLISEVGRNQELTQALVEFSELKSDGGKSWHIENDLKDLAKILLTEEGQLNMDKLKNTGLSQFFNIRKQLAAELNSYESQLKEIASSAQCLIDRNNISENSFYQGSRGIGRFFKNITNGDLSKVENSNAYTSVTEGKWLSGKPSEGDKAAIESIQNELANAYHQIKSYYEQYNSRHVLIGLIFKNIYSLSVLNEIDKLIDTIKQENNLIHISDFNRLISEVVMGEPAPFIYERMGYRYQNFLVDEFQDTSVMQWQNLMPLFDESLAREQFTMVVGDAKQAIYRWRGGQVEQFSKLPTVHLSPSLKNKMVEDPFFERIALDREATLQRNYSDKRLGNNFRSKREVVDFNNQFFRFVSTNLDNEFQGIYSGLEQQYQDANSGGYVSIEFVPNDDKETHRELTLNQVLEHINNCLQDGFRLQDIAILTRSNAQGSDTARFLITNNIPVISSESLLLSSSEDVNFLISLFRYMLDNTNMIAGAEITRWLCKYGLEGKDFHTELNRLNEDKKVHLLNEFLQLKSPDTSLKYMSRLPLYEIAETLVSIFMSDEPNPYIQFFLDKVLAFSSKKGNNIFGLIEWWELNKGKFSIIVPEAHDAVRVMTIHKSKGLEFPVVIYPFASDKADARNKLLWVNLEKDNIEGLPTAVVNVSSELEKTSHAHEYMIEQNKLRLDVYNLLYVALTRPSHRLYVLTERQKPTYNNMDSTACLFREFLKVKELYNEEELAYSFGAPIPYQSESKSLHEGYELSSTQSRDWRNKVFISRQSELVWDIDQERQERIDYGNLIHTALSRINDYKDIQAAVESMQEEGLIKKKEVNGLTKKISQLINQPDIKPLFEKGQKLRIEADILLEDGTWLRPDRLIIADNKIKIVEFKTGGESDKHVDQVNKYEALLKDMGYAEIEKYLVYTTEERLLKI